MNNGPERSTYESDPHQSGVEDGVREDALERVLAQTLRQPLRLPGGFAERVAAAAEGKPARQGGRTLPFALRWRTWQLVGGSAIAAALVAGVFAVEGVHGYRERTRRQAVATEQFETATRITDQALAHTREQLERAGALRGQ